MSLLGDDPMALWSGSCSMTARDILSNAEMQNVAFDEIAWRKSREEGFNYPCPGNKRLPEWPPNWIDLPQSENGPLEFAQAREVQGDIPEGTDQFAKPFTTPTNFKVTNPGPLPFSAHASFGTSIEDAQASLSEGGLVHPLVGQSAAQVQAQAAQGVGNSFQPPQAPVFGGAGALASLNPSEAQNNQDLMEAAQALLGNNNYQQPSGFAPHPAEDHHDGGGGCDKGIIGCVGNAYGGVFYDLSHWSQLPVESLGSKLHWTFVRDDRPFYLALGLAGAILIGAVLGSIYRAIRGTQASSAKSTTSISSLPRNNGGYLPAYYVPIANPAQLRSAAAPQMLYS